VLGVGARSLDGLMSAPQLGGGDHLHGARDLLRVLNADDPALDVS
jgi:hypothetical protein